jgi:hypothetical protein
MNSSSKSQQICFAVLAVSAITVFLGRSYQHIFWDAPFRAILWDEKLMSGMLSRMFSISWDGWAENASIDKTIQRVIKTIGYIYLSIALAIIFYKKTKHFLKYFLLFGILSLAFLAFASTKEKFFQLGETMEFGIQIASPLILFLTLYSHVKASTLIWIAKVSIAFTFIGHGLYAFGFYPQPGYYVDMIISVFGWEENLSRDFLRLMAMADFAAAVFILIPNADKPALVYCIVWGFLTALARTVGHFNHDFALQSLHQWAFETIFRLSHGLLPIWVYCQLYFSRIKRT